MFGICNFFDQRAWVQDQWQFVLSNFEINDFWTIGCPENHEKEFTDPTRIDHLGQLPIDREIVIFSPPNASYYPGTKNLMSFEHPKDAIYVFGADNVDFDPEIIRVREPHSCVYIPSGKYEMYSFVAAAVSLHDRRMKLGNN